jgi:hypothetical protein
MAGLLTLSGAFAAETAYTTPRGIYTVKVPGATQPSAPVRTYIGIQLLPELSYFGRAATVSGNTLSLEHIDQHNYFSTPDRKSYLHVLEGSGRGFITDIDEFRDSDMVCAEDLTQWIQPDTLVRIRPHPGLSDILGADNPYGLGAGPDADTADNMVIWDPDAQQEKVYYFHSVRARWEEKGIEADAGNAVFRYPYGFYIVRRSPGTLRIKLSGNTGLNDAGQLEPVLLPVHHGANVFSLPINLSGSLDAIVRADGSFPVVSGTNARSSDILTFEEPTTGLRRGPFYHLSRPNASGWREVGVNDSTASIEPLDYLSTLILWRNGDAGRLLVEGSLEPPAVPRPLLPPDPEPGEPPLRGELVIPRQLTNPNFFPNLTYVFENSEDLQTWVPFSASNSEVFIEPDGSWRLTFELPAGQRRVFYRLKVTSGS